MKQYTVIFSFFKTKSAQCYNQQGNVAKGVYNICVQYVYKVIKGVPTASKKCQLQFFFLTLLLEDSRFLCAGKTKPNDICVLASCNTLENTWRMDKGVSLASYCTNCKEFNGCMHIQCLFVHITVTHDLPYTFDKHPMKKIGFPFKPGPTCRH